MIRFANTRLIVDPSMGKLVRWLRILGFDTHYDQDLNMHHVVSRAKKDFRILLTCSENTLNLAKKERISAFLVPNTEPSDQLKVMARQGFDLSLPDFNQTRCPNCNGGLSLATIEEEDRLVPEGSRDMFDEYFICRSCDQMYWKGSHWENIMKIIEEIS